MDNQKFNAGDRVKNVSGETFIVHQCHDNGAVTVIPDYNPIRTISLRAEALTIVQHTSF